MVQKTGLLISVFGEEASVDDRLQTIRNINHIRIGRCPSYENESVHRYLSVPETHLVGALVCGRFCDWYVCTYVRGREG
jgi:hypothetical protein